jgi:rod shape-determining protein MreD
MLNRPINRVVGITTLLAFVLSVIGTHMTAANIVIDLVALAVILMALSFNWGSRGEILFVAIGLAADIALGDVLGMHVVKYAILSLAVSRMSNIIKMAGIGQQVILVALLLALSEVTPRGLSAVFSPNLFHLDAILISTLCAVVWPIVNYSQSRE